MPRTVAQDITRTIATKKTRVKLKKYADIYADASISDGSLFNLQELRDLVMPHPYEKPARKNKRTPCKLSLRMSDPPHRLVKSTHPRRELALFLDDRPPKQPRYRVRSMIKMAMGKNTESQVRFRIKSFWDEERASDQAIMH